MVFISTESFLPGSQKAYKIGLLSFLGGKEEMEGLMYDAQGLLITL